MAQLELELWRAFAVAAVRLFIVARGGAVIWPELEAFLAFGSWVPDNVPGAAAVGVKRIDPHHLTYARQTLELLGELRRAESVLQGRTVAAWIHVPTRDELQATSVDRRAASVRRRYRTFLGWTRNETCGDVAERLTHATLRSLAGRHLWIDDAPRGQVARLDGKAVPGGPLDHAGYWAINPDDPRAGWVPFAVEVKNVRHLIYPTQREIWDLLAKAGAFPDRVPVLITRRVHYWTYKMFATLGAVAYQSERQWFSPTIDPVRFAAVTRDLGLTDAIRVANPDAPNAALTKWLTVTLRKPTHHDPRQLMVRSAELWARAAPICANYLTLREDLDPDERHETYEQFLEDLEAEGFDTEDFAGPLRE